MRAGVISVTVLPHPARPFQRQCGHCVYPFSQSRTSPRPPCRWDVRAPRPSQSLPRVPLNVRGGTSYVHAAPGPRAPLMRHLQTCPDAGSCPQASLFRPVRAEDEILPLRCHTDKCQPSSKRAWVWGAAALRALHPDLLNRRAMSRLDPASWFPTIHVNPAAARRGRNRAA